MSKSYVDPEMLWLIKNSQETQWLRNTKVKKHNGQNGQTLEPHKFLSKRIIKIQSQQCTKDLPFQIQKRVTVGHLVQWVLFHDFHKRFKMLCLS